MARERKSTPSSCEEAYRRDNTRAKAAVHSPSTMNYTKCLQVANAQSQYEP
jgi:hypothetical protein